MFMDTQSSLAPLPSPWLIEHGVEIPTRVFVGNLPYDTNDLELKDFFSKYGEIADCNIVTDRQGISKGYGFITFSSQKDAHKVLLMETILYKMKELNISKAIRRQSSQQYSKVSKEYINGRKGCFILPNHCEPGKMLYSVIQPLPSPLPPPPPPICYPPLFPYTLSPHFIPTPPAPTGPLPLPTTRSSNTNIAPQPVHPPRHYYN